MKDKLFFWKRVLFTVIVLAYLYVVLYALYRFGYSLFVVSTFSIDCERVWWYIYSNNVLRDLSIILLHSCFVILYVFWKKPKPKLIFILLLISFIFPTILNEASWLICLNMPNSFISRIADVAVIPLAILFMWIIWSTLFLLSRRSEKDARHIIIVYMVKFGLIMIRDLIGWMESIYVDVITNVCLYASEVMTIVICVLTIVYLNKKLKGNHMFVNLRKLNEKQCNNTPLVKD